MTDRPKLQKQMSLVSTARAVDREKAGEKKETLQFKRNSTSLIQLENQAAEFYTSFPRLKDHEYQELVSRFGERFSENFVNLFTPSRLLGQGGSGTVLAACRDRYTCAAVKIQQIFSRTDFEREVNMQKKFSRMSLGPAILSDPTFFSHDGKYFGVIVMDTVVGDLMSLLEKNLAQEYVDVVVSYILNMIVLIAKAGFTHGDFSIANMVYVYNRDAWSEMVLRPLMIDFGWTTSKVVWPQYDTLQMLRTSLPQFTPNMHPRCRESILSVLLKFYNENFGRLDLEDVDRRWNEMSIEYRRIVEEKRTMLTRKRKILRRRR